MSPRRERNFSFSSDDEDAVAEPFAAVEEDEDAGAEAMPPRIPETMLEVLDGAVVVGVDDGAEVVEAPKEKEGAEVVVPEEVEELVVVAAGLAAPKPAKPPKGLAFAGGCEDAAVLALGVVDAPKLNVGVDADVAGAGAEGVLPNPPPAPPRLAKGLEPPGALKGDEDAAPKVTGLGAAAPGAPGVPGVPLRLGSPRITLPAAGVAGIEPCDGESSSDALSPSSLRICFSA